MGVVVLGGGGAGALRKGFQLKCIGTHAFALIMVIVVNICKSCKAIDST